MDDGPGHKGTELARTPIQLKSGDWTLKVVPWIGGRVISMEHGPSGVNLTNPLSTLISGFCFSSFCSFWLYALLTGTQWLHSRVDMNGYEEYSGTEYRSAGCTEEYSVIE